MAVMRVRDLHQLARDGVAVEVGDGDWSYSLSDLYGATTPPEWTPQLDDVGDWSAGNYEVIRAAAWRVAAELNASKPWE